MTDTESRPLARETEAPPDAEMEGPLRENRDFVVVLAGQGVSAIGDAINYTALPLLVLFLTGSGLAMGIVGVLQTLPDLVLGLPVGALADRWDRRRMMLYADLGRAVLTAFIPAGLRPRAADDGGHHHRDGTDQRPAGGVARGLHGRRAEPRREGPHRPGELDVRGDLRPRFHRRAGVAGVLAATIGPAPTLAIDAATYLASSSPWHSSGGPCGRFGAMLRAT